MTVGVDQAGQQGLLAEIMYFTGVAPFDLTKFSDVGNSIRGNRDRAVLDGRPIHCNDRPCAKDHSPLTTFLHSAISRLQAS